MRKQAPDISIRSEIGFEEDLMRGLIEGRIDVGLMYTPQHNPGLQIEHLQRFHIRLITPKFGSVQHISVGGQALPDHQAKPDLQNTLLVRFMGY